MRVEFYFPGTTNRSSVRCSARRETLFVGVVEERLDGAAVLLEGVAPWVSRMAGAAAQGVHLLRG